MEVRSGRRGNEKEGCARKDGRTGGQTESKAVETRGWKAAIHYKDCEEEDGGTDRKIEVGRGDEGMGRRDALVRLCRRQTDRRTDGAGKGVTSNGKDRCSNKAVKERTDEQTESWR